MAIAVPLPALGESVIEGTVARWLVKEGDRVEIDQPLVEITTDKVDAEIPSPATGVVQQIMVAEGETVDIGTELARIDPRVAKDSPAHTAHTAHTARAASPLATPVARRLADEAQVDLNGIRGTGSAGRITKSDVLHHAEPPARSTAPPPETLALSPPPSPPWPPTSSPMTRPMTRVTAAAIAVLTFMGSPFRS